MYFISVDTACGQLGPKPRQLCCERSSSVAGQMPGGIMRCREKTRLGVNTYYQTGDLVSSWPWQATGSRTTANCFMTSLPLAPGDHIHTSRGGRRSEDLHGSGSMALGGETAHDCTQHIDWPVPPCPRCRVRRAGVQVPGRYVVGGRARGFRLGVEPSSPSSCPHGS